MLLQDGEPVSLALIRTRLSESLMQRRPGSDMYYGVRLSVTGYGIGTTIANDWTLVTASYTPTESMNLNFAAGYFQSVSPRRRGLASLD